VVVRFVDIDKIAGKHFLHFIS